VSPLAVGQVPDGRLELQSVRRVAFINAADLAELGYVDGAILNLISEWEDGVQRRADGFRLVEYATPKGCVAAYYPETNPLIPWTRWRWRATPPRRGGWSSGSCGPRAPEYPTTRALGRCDRRSAGCRDGRRRGRAQSGADAGARGVGRAEEGEALGAMPADLVERLKAARLFVMWQPRALGGLEVDPLTVGRTPTRSSRSGS
jgi:Anaerobic dehydrogenases, typically selenocysteine-containing